MMLKSLVPPYWKFGGVGNLAKLGLNPQLRGRVWVYRALLIQISEHRITIAISIITFPIKRIMYTSIGLSSLYPIGLY